MKIKATTKLVVILSLVIAMSSNVLAINATYYTTGGTISVPWEFRNDVQYTAGGTYMYMPGRVQKNYYSFDTVTINETILINKWHNQFLKCKNPNILKSICISKGLSGVKIFTDYYEIGGMPNSIIMLIAMIIITVGCYIGLRKSTKIR